MPKLNPPELAEEANEQEESLEPIPGYPTRILYLHASIKSGAWNKASEIEEGIYKILI